MTYPQLAQVEAYWEALRGDRPAPLRSEIDPRGIDTALEFAFILERIAPGVCRFRLAGMHLNDLMGMEVRGMALASFFAPAARDRIAKSLEHVFEEPAKAVHHVASRGECGTADLAGQMILLPLRSDLGDVSRALGCFVTSGRPGRSPHRFTLERSDVRALSGRPVSFDSDTPRAPRPVPGFGEPPRLFGRSAEATRGSGAAPSAPRRGHLRLVSTTDAGSSDPQ